MSLSRMNEDGEYFDVKPGYVYVTGEDMGQHTFNTRIQTVEQFCELSMRALAQSGELDDAQLEACEQALRERFNYCFENNE